jgi:hypothetical protein
VKTFTFISCVSNIRPDVTDIVGSGFVEVEATAQRLMRVGGSYRKWTASRRCWGVSLDGIFYCSARRMKCELLLEKVLIYHLLERMAGRILLLACVLLVSFHQRLWFERLLSAHLSILNLWKRELDLMAKSSGARCSAIAYLIGQSMDAELYDEKIRWVTASCKRCRCKNSTYFLGGWIRSPSR